MIARSEMAAARERARAAMARTADLRVITEAITDRNRAIRNNARDVVAQCHLMRRRNARRRAENGAEHDDLVLHHTPLARSLAQRFVARGHSREDLEQVAMVGLVMAANRFDPSRGTAFSTYATSTILGELKRFFRSTSWRVHVPRSLQERYLAVRDAAEAYRDLHQRAPTIAELATAVGCGVDAVIEAMGAGDAMVTASLSHAADTGVPDIVDAMDPIAFFIDSHTVEQLLQRLPERERAVVALRYREELSQREIAARVGVSQMQVSRMLRRAGTRLQAWATD
jgi:RNA polymerase sigma-B factor